MKRIVFAFLAFFVVDLPAWAVDYELTDTGEIFRHNDDGSVSTLSADQKHPDRVRYEEWKTAGNTPRPAPPSTLVSPSWDGSAWVEGTPLADYRLIRSQRLAADLIAYQNAHYPSGVLAAINRARSRGTATARVAAFDAWIDTVTAHYAAALAAINDPVADMATVQGVTWDFAQFDATDPHVKLTEVM